MNWLLSGLLAVAVSLLTAACNGDIEKPINPETFVAELHAFGPPRANGGAS